jgi:cell wall-associated NlpC family hydrolase
MYNAPSDARGLDNEVVFGERVRVFDDAGGWAWVQLARDNYMGYVPAAALSGESVATTHRVKVPATFVYPEANIKSTPLGQLSLGAEVAVAGEGDRFVPLATGGYVIARHLNATGIFARDFVEVAESLIHTPYLWGGRTRSGLDCSGLVQVALEAAGHACPRDSDMQASEVGETVLVPSDLEGLRRGDLIFWPGHVGLLIDSVMLLHANAFHMATVIEPLSQAVRRIAKGNTATGDRGQSISAIKRLAARA